jgi:hypothetical protein
MIGLTYHIGRSAVFVRWYTYYRMLRQIPRATSLYLETSCREYVVRSTVASQELARMCCPQAHSQREHKAAAAGGRVERSRVYCSINAYVRARALIMLEIRDRLTACVSRGSASSFITPSIALTRVHL